MATLPLLRRDITLDEALDDDDNILVRLGYPGQQRDFWDHLSARKNEVEDIVRFHLGAKSCQVADKDAWLVGSYNVGIPVHINLPSDARVLVRTPLP